MKRLLSSLLIVAALLSGCSQGDDGGTGKRGLRDFKPNEKPQNPAPKAYVDSLFASLSKSKKYLPEDAAIFNKIIDGTEIKYIFDGSQERIDARGKLYIEGIRFIDEIKANCIINDAAGTQTGDQPRTGATITQKAWLSTFGSSCPYLISKQNQATTIFNQFDYSNESIVVDANITQTNFLSNEVKDPRQAALSGVQSMAMNFKMNGNVKFSQTRSSKKSSIVMTGAGDLQIRFANGDSVTGPLSMEVLSEDEKTETQILFEGKSTQGDIRVVIKMKSDSTMELYINGERFAPVETGHIIETPRDFMAFGLTL